MLLKALEAEVEEYIRRSGDSKETGRAPVVRNGRTKSRTLKLGAARIEVEAPRVHDRRLGMRFVSKILPPYVRRAAKFDALMRLVAETGLARDELSEALSALLENTDLSITAVARLRREWKAVYSKMQETVCARRVAERPERSTSEVVSGAYAGEQRRVHPERRATARGPARPASSAVPVRKAES